MSETARWTTFSTSRTALPRPSSAPSGPALRSAEIARAQAKPTGNLDAYDLYLRALPNYHSSSNESLADSAALLRKAILLDPSFVRAKAFLAGLATDFCVGWSATDARRAGFIAAVIEDACRAIDLNSSLAAAWDKMAKAGVQRLQSTDIQASAA